MIKNIDSGAVISENPCFAETFLQRLTGLMGRRSFPCGHDSMVFKRCNSIHCFFMLMEIDVIFIDCEGHVVKTFSRLKPWRLAFGGRNGETVIELPAGTIEKSGTVTGNTLISG